jgi:uncharacterized protein YcfL
MKKLFNQSGRTTGLILLLLIFVLHTGCKQKQETKPGEEAPKETQSTQTTEENTAPSKGVSRDKSLLATVNGQPIYKQDLKGKNLDDVIIDEILYQDAIKRGLDKTFKSDNKKLIVELVKQDIINKMPKRQAPTTQEIEDYFKKNQIKYTNLMVIGITAKDEKVADEIQKRAVKGEDFDEIASDQSDSAVKAMLKPSYLPIDKNDYFKSFEIGTVSDVVKDSGSFSVYKIVDIYRIPLSKVQSSIVNIVDAKKKYNAVREFAEKARNQDNIEVVMIKGEK